MLIVLISGTIISFLSGPQNPRELHPKLLCKITFRPQSYQVIHSSLHLDFINIYQRNFYRQKNADSKLDVLELQ